MEDQIPFDPELQDRMAIGPFVENFSRAVLNAVEPSIPNRRPRADRRSPIPAAIQDEIRLKYGLRRQWQITRFPTLTAEVNRLQRSVARRLNEWRNDQWSVTLGSLDTEDQSLCRMAKRVMRVPTPSPPWIPLAESLSQTLRKPKPYWHYRESFSSGCRHFCPSSY